MDIDIYKNYLDYYGSKDSDVLRKWYWNFQGCLSRGGMCNISKESYKTRCDAIKSVLVKRLDW